MKLAAILSKNQYCVVHLRLMSATNRLKGGPPLAQREVLWTQCFLHSSSPSIVLVGGVNFVEIKFPLLITVYVYLIIF